METKKIQRNSAIELLRVMAMLFIIMSHASVHGGFQVGNMPLNINKVYLQVSILGNLGVDIFVIITGYLLCDKGHDIKRIIKILIQTWMYSIFTFLLAILVFKEQVTIKMFINAIFPVITGKYWFVTVYICLMFISPLLNTAIYSMRGKEHLKVVFTMLFLWSVIPTFTSFEMYGNEVIEFIMFYLIGAYFRKNPENLLYSKRLAYLLTIISIILYVASIIMLDIISVYIPVLMPHVTYFNKRNSLLIIGIAVGLFAIAVNKKPFINSVINCLGGTTLGIYLLHDSSDIREILWQKLICNNYYADSKILIPRIFISTLLVFSCGVIVEIIRKKLLEKNMLCFVDKIKFCILKRRK